ncbi:hypothetical protein [Streptomyces sp. NPDC046685]|uniref:hypothetical protein n=1 Tax=Streptomyces sp. NPDC046685 TaxID=3157202 RepID=UPI0033C6FFC0
MGKEQHEAGPQGVVTCPECGYPVHTVIKRRHKTLGVFVPVWGPGPCQNQDCLAYQMDPRDAAPHERPS